MLKLTKRTANTATLLLSPLIIATATVPIAPKEIRVHYIDVGQDDAILIQSAQNTVLIDGGTDNLGLGFKSYKLSPSNFKVWRSEEITEENIERQLEAFIDPVKPESQVEDILVELILKSGYKLTEKVVNCGDFYYINNELVVALTKINQEIAAKIMNLSPKPQKVIVLDRLFEGSDELKTNTALQMRDAGVELRTI